jgi:DNA-binding NarL/FixJ family response regulator
MIKKTITIIDADKNFCAVVSGMIEESTDFLVNQIYFDTETAIKRLLRDKPDIIVLDLDFVEQKGIDFIIKAKEKAHWIKILILTNIEDQQIASQAISNGAFGYVYKKNFQRDLLDALAAISDGGAPIDPFVACHVISSIQVNRFSPLSNRETMVLKHMMQGKNSTGIANDLIISRQTVRTHVKNIYRKLKVNSREQALRKAVDDQLIVGNLGFVFQ